MLIFSFILCLIRKLNRFDYACKTEILIMNVGGLSINDIRCFLCFLDFLPPFVCIFPYILDYVRDIARECAHVWAIISRVSTRHYFVTYLMSLLVVYTGQNLNAK